MKRYQVFIIAVLMSLCSVIGSASANTIVFMNVPLVQKSDEELQQYLKLCKWEELPTNTKMDARIWTFGADERRCAIQISDKLYTFEDGKVRGCYSFSTNPYQLWFEGDYLVIHEIRGDFFLFWNWNTGEMALYAADRDSLNIEQQQKLSTIYYTMNRGNSVINGNGYYISNHYSWTGYLTTASEMLVYVKDGHETVIYENYVNLWISILCILFIVAGLIVGIYFLRRGVRRKKRSTGRSQS